MLEGSNAGRIFGRQTVADQLTAIFNSNGSHSECQNQNHFQSTESGPPLPRNGKVDVTIRIVKTAQNDTR